MLFAEPCRRGGVDDLGFGTPFSFLCWHNSLPPPNPPARSFQLASPETSLESDGRFQLARAVSLLIIPSTEDATMTNGVHGKGKAGKPEDKPKSPKPKTKEKQ